MFMHIYLLISYTVQINKNSYYNKSDINKPYNYFSFSSSNSKIQSYELPSYNTNEACVALYSI